MTKDGKSQTYRSQSEAAKSIGIGQSYISRMCRGKAGPLRGFMCSFAVDGEIGSDSEVPDVELVVGREA